MLALRAKCITTALGLATAHLVVSRRLFGESHLNSNISLMLWPHREVWNRNCAGLEP